MNILYCINKKDLSVLQAGYLPEVWENINGINVMDYESLQDLSFAGHEDIGFFTRDDAEALGADKTALDAALAQGAIVEGNNVRERRQDILTHTVDKVNAIRWAAMSTDEQAQCNTFYQALTDIPTQAGFPWVIEWPEVPACLA